MNLSPAQLKMLRIFTIICMLFVGGSYVMNAINMHDAMNAQAGRNTPLPLGKILFVAIPILATVWLTGNGKRIGFWVYLIFAITLSALTYFDARNGGIVRIQQDQIYQWLLWLLPIPLLHFALPINLKNDK